MNFHLAKHSQPFRENQKIALISNREGISLAVQWLRLCAPNAGGLGSIPGRGTTSHMLQLRVWMLQLKIPHMAAKILSIPTSKTKVHILVMILVFWGFFTNLFIYFWLHWVFIAACRLSLVVASRGYSSLWCAGFSLWWLLLLRSTYSRHTGFSSCGARA